MANDVAIKVDNISKTFRLPHEKYTSVKSALIHFNKRGYEKQQVLTDVNFEIKKGEFFGIVGRNGSGKSTLLKLLAGIYTPSSGTIEVNGKLTPFIELGVGFNPELTGRENVFLNGALLGFNRKQMAAMYSDIVDFAELHRFMDQKLKNYSSGMQVRLAFSIAIRANSDILVLDEVLAVGDESFQRKCFDYFIKLKKANKTVILVTHDMNSVERFCDRAMLIKEGRVLTIGSPQLVAAKYTIENLPQSTMGSDAPDDKKPDYGIGIGDIEILNHHKPSTSFSKGDTIQININYHVSKQIKATFGVSFRSPDDTLLASLGSTEDLGIKTFKPGKGVARCEIPAKQFRKGAYKVNVSVWSDNHTLLDYIDSTMGSNTPAIYIVDELKARAGIFSLDGEWKSYSDG